jgi:hypothetical protein
MAKSKASCFLYTPWIYFTTAHIALQGIKKARDQAGFLFLMLSSTRCDKNAIFG